MDYELEVFEVYDDSEQQPSSKKHLKHTRKKCKHKGGSIINLDKTTDNDIHRSKSSVVSGDCTQQRRLPISLRQSLLSFFTKLVVWRDQRRYQATTIPDRAESAAVAHSSKDFRRGLVSCGEFYSRKSVNFHLKTNWNVLNCLGKQHEGEQKCKVTLNFN